jgi:hypothetical protein
MFTFSDTLIDLLIIRFSATAFTPPSFDSLNT